MGTNSRSRERLDLNLSGPSLRVTVSCRERQADVCSFRTAPRRGDRAAARTPETQNRTASMQRYCGLVSVDQPRVCSMKTLFSRRTCGHVTSSWGKDFVISKGKKTPPLPKTPKGGVWRNHGLSDANAWVPIRSLTSFMQRDPSSNPTTFSVGRTDCGVSHLGVTGIEFKGLVEPLA